MQRARPGLYVHVPFCTSVCPYCDFAVTLAGEERRRGWERALVAEAGMYRGVVDAPDTVYVGGGTPSALATSRLERVLAGLRRELAVRADAGLFLEANPEDVDGVRARRWAELGVSFASVGVQSLDDDALRFLGRRHDAAAGRRAVDALLDAGLATVSADLIFGLPGQTASAWRRQLEAVVALGVQHVSCYQLTIHDQTVFGRRRKAGGLRELAEDEQAALYLLAHRVLGDAGLEAYEVSNFARPGHRSRHNLKYWTGASYLGIGPSAHSFDGRGRRWWNERKLRLWQRRVTAGERPVSGLEELTPVQCAFEQIMLGLRLADGVDLGQVEERWRVGLTRASRRALERDAERGLIEIEGRRVRPTARGMAVADGLAREVDLAPCTHRFETPPLLRP
jgi:oxygen-independent coproporphyrinogen-3 oxidase